MIVSLIYTPFLPFVAPTEMPSNSSIFAVVTLALVCTVLAFILFFALIDEIGPVRVTLITYLNPAVALILGVVFLSEPITIGLAIGFPMVIIGSWFASSVSQRTESVNA
jgi:drug/metabolite transporter (DMT)-like permease